MVWSVRYNSETNIVEVVYTGLVTGTELTEAATKRIQLQEEHRTSFVLCDATGIEQISAGTFDIFALPDKLYGSKSADRESRIALVLPRLQKAREKALFFETACINRGWIVKTFEKYNDAVAWLLGTTPSNKPDARDGL